MKTPLEDLFDISPEVHCVKTENKDFFSIEYTDNDHVFTYIESGEAEFIISDKSYHLTEGAVIIMPPFKAHIIKNYSAEHLVQQVIHFDMYSTGILSAPPEEPEEFLPSPPANPFPSDLIAAKRNSLLDDKVICAHLSGDEKTLVTKIISRMLDEYTARHNYFPLALKASMIELLCLLLRSSSNQNVISHKKGKTWFSIERALAYMKENFHNPDISNDEISEAAGLSVNYLANAFNSKLNMSVHEYLNCVRIDNAKKLILLGDGNFTEISKKVGFSSIHVFSKAFKRHEGCSPSEFLKRNS